MKTTGIPQTLSGIGQPGADVRVASQSAPKAGAKVIGAPPRQIPSHTDRDAFSLRLQRRFHQFAVSDTPFLIIAMRCDGEAASSLDFPWLVDCVCQLLGVEDDWFVDLHHKRLVILLSESRPHEGHCFFARLKQRLLQDLPQQAEIYLYGVTAIVVPNGGHFQNAEDFLAVALEET